MIYSIHALHPTPETLSRLSAQLGSAEKAARAIQVNMWEEDGEDFYAWLTPDGSEKALLGP